MKRLVLALVALAAIVAVATPALADYNFYGSMRLKTNYVYNDVANANDDDAALELQANSRFGLNATTGDIGGRVELGLRDSSGGQGYNTYTRLIYGTWKTDAGTLLIGQTYAPYWTAYAMVYKDDDGFNGRGELYEGRKPMIKFDFTSGLYVAAIQNQQDAVAGAKTFMPKLNVGFKNKAGALSYNVGAAYQTYDSLAAPKRTVVSYLTYLELVMKQEAMTVQGKVHYGQNLKEFGFTGRSSSYVAATNSNTENYGGVVQVSVDMFNVGASYCVDDREGAKANKNFTAFINANIKPVKGFTITPEIAYYDNDVNAFDFDGADVVAATIQWKMDF